MAACYHRALPPQPDCMTGQRPSLASEPPPMPGHCILSHGLDSNPNASKVSALARAAEAAGWTTQRPDYSDLDASADAARLPCRIARLLDAVRAAPPGPLVLAGSSLGAYTSALASLECTPCGLFLIAPPVILPGGARALEARPVPTWVVHGWQDALIPAQQVIDWCQARALPLTLLDDSHRLSGHAEWLAETFVRFLRSLSA